MSATKIALLRGFWLNNFEMQNYAPLQNQGFELAAYATADHLFEVNLIQMPVTVLPTPRTVAARVPGVRRLVGNNFRRRGIHEYWPQDVDKLVATTDIVHAAETTNGFSWQAAQAAKKRNKRLVLTIWENIPFLYEDRPGVQAQKQEVVAATDLFLAITERARTALRIEGIPEEKIRVIGCGIDQSHFQPTAKDAAMLDRFGLSADDLVILCACQLLPSKGLYEFFSAIALLRERRQLPPNVRVLLIGEGAGRAALEARRARLRLDEVLLMPGKVSYAEMPVVHNLANIFVLPSIPTPTWQEQFGMVLAESMACAKPVISTLSGSIPDVVGEDGLLVQAADPTALADALATLISDEALRAQLGEKALVRARAQFDSQRVAETIAACYRELF